MENNADQKQNNGNLSFNRDRGNKKGFDPKKKFDGKKKPFKKEKTFEYGLTIGDILKGKK